MQQPSIKPASVQDFKKFAAQALRSHGWVCRWYQKIVHATSIVEMSTYYDLPREYKDGWKAHKPELKELGFGMVKISEEPDFLLFVNADNARKWLEGEKILEASM